MSYSLGIIAKNKAVKFNQLGSVIDRVRTQINQARIINEYGSVCGFCFQSEDYSPPTETPARTYFHEVKIHNKPSIWIIKCIYDNSTRLTGADLLEQLKLNKYNFNFLLFEETANWWAAKGLNENFEYYPPWLLETDKYLLISVRDTDTFASSTIGKTWINEFGSRADNSFLFIDQLNKLQNEKPLLEAVITIIKNPEIQYKQEGLVCEWQSGKVNFHLFKSAWPKTTNSSESATLLEDNDTLYYTGESCVAACFAPNLSKLHSTIPGEIYTINS